MQAERFLLNKKSLHTLTLYSFKNTMFSDAEWAPGRLPQDTAFCSYAHQSYNFVLQEKVTESQCKLNHVTTQSWCDDLITVPGKGINSIPIDTSKSSFQ